MNLRRIWRSISFHVINSDWGAFWTVGGGIKILSSSGLKIVKRV